MNASEKYYRRWIRDIGRRTSPRNIKKHIQHHAGDLDDATRNSPRSWAASMHNLLAIYEEVHGLNAPVSDKLFKLGKKYFRFAGKTPPPGGKIPLQVKLSWMAAGKKKRPGEKMVTLKDLRSIGRGGKPHWSN